jgi:diguanylate cyclase (GGDEF)-like protein
MSTSPFLKNDVPGDSTKHWKCCKQAGCDIIKGHKAATDQPTMPTNAARRCPMVPVGARRVIMKPLVVSQTQFMTAKPLESVKILLLAETAENVRFWTEMLSPISACIWVDSASIPQDQQPEVVITDGTPVFEGNYGVIRIGSDVPADVNLPDRPSPRELQLACRLLAEIVRLRRRELSFTELQHRLYTEAFTDPLTGLPNRRAWDQTLRERLGAATDSRCLCLAIFDLDHFKQVNDAFGHAAGDEVLKSVASSICESLRQGDFVARIGGDEFGLLIWVSDPGIAPAVVERVRTALPDRLTASGIHRVTASAGLAGVSSSTPTTSPGTLFAQADEALRRAKQEGRDRTMA